MSQTKDKTLTNRFLTNRRSFVVGLGAALASPALPAFAAADLSVEHVLAPCYLGDIDAPVQVIEYFSMTCGHCGNFHRNAFPSIKENLIDTGQVRFEMRSFPLDGLALRAHALARIIPVDSFYPFIDRLLSQQSEWTRAADPLSMLMKYARMAGVSEAEFNAAMRERSLLEAIVAERQKAVDEWRFSLTPSLVVNEDKLLSGNMNYETFVAELSPYGV